MHASPSRRRPYWAVRWAVTYVLVGAASFAAGYYTAPYIGHHHAMHVDSVAQPPGITVPGRHAAAPAHAAQRPVWDGRSAYPANGPAPSCSPAIAGRMASLGMFAVRCTPGHAGAFTWQRAASLSAWHASHAAHLRHAHAWHLKHIDHVRSIE